MGKFECYSFEVDQVRAYEGRVLEMRQTFTQFTQNGDTFSFPDGFTLFEENTEVGRLALESVEICADHENCFISLPHFFTLELRAPRVVVLVDEELFCNALRGSAVQILEAYRIIPILLHMVSELQHVQLQHVSGEIAQEQPNLTKDQQDLIAAMKQMHQLIQVPQATSIRVGDTNFWVDIGQQSIVEKPCTKVCDLHCSGGFIVSPPGYGRKRAVLAHALACSVPQANDQQQECLLCHFPIGVISAPEDLPEWRYEAEQFSASVLIVGDIFTQSALTVESFQQYQVVIISSRFLESPLFWSCPAEYVDSRFRRCDIVMHQRRQGKLATSCPLLDLTFWKVLIFAQPTKPILTKSFHAGQRWVFLPSVDLISLHRVWELLQPTCSADFPLSHFASSFGLEWAPEAQLPLLSAESVAVELTSMAKAHLLHGTCTRDESCGPMKRRKMLVKPQRLCNLVLSSNQTYLKKIENDIRKIRAQEKLWHQELQSEDQPIEWDSSLMGDWTVVRDRIVQSELDRVEANIKKLKTLHHLFAQVEQHHLESTIADECPVCGDPNEAIFRCGHGTCWSCAFTMFRDKKTIKCPECRTSLSRNDVWLLENEGGSNKFQALQQILENTEKPCLILMESTNGCRALMRFLKNFAPKYIHNRFELSQEINIGKYSKLKTMHFPIRHLISMNPLRQCQPMIQHIANPNANCRHTSLFYKDLEQI